MQAIIIKGNPRYIEGNRYAEAFYRELESFLTGLGYEVSFDPGEPYTTPPPADLWVGHSRGAGRLKFAPKGTRTLALGTIEGVYHPEDASVNDFSIVPDKYHYMLTSEMKEALRKADPDSDLSVEKIASRIAFNQLPPHPATLIF